MTRTPQRPVTVAKTTFEDADEEQRLPPVQLNRMAAILQAARFTVAMMMQLNRNPRYTERNPRTTLAAFPE